MQKIVPFLWFDDQAEEAANFYTSIFKHGKIGEISRYGDDMPVPKGKVMTVSFEISGMEFTGLNGGPEFKFTPAISFFVYCETPDEVDALWSSLTDGGSVLMELGPYPFSEKYGWLKDRYGVTWQLHLARIPQKISPALLFVGEQNGRAEEAVRLYTSLFEDAKIIQIERYGNDPGVTEGTVMLARFLLNGQELIAMDGGLEHDFTFTPAISLYVHCKDQPEVDYFWERLTEGGEEQPCGWLTDRFGVSWQIIPDTLIELMGDPDAQKAYRVTQAMLQMRKIDISQLEKAYAAEERPV